MTGLTEQNHCCGPEPRFVRSGDQTPRARARSEPPAWSSTSHSAYSRSPRANARPHRCAWGAGAPRERQAAPYPGRVFARCRPAPPPSSTPARSSRASSASGALRPLANVMVGTHCAVPGTTSQRRRLQADRVERWQTHPNFGLLFTPFIQRSISA